MAKAKKVLTYLVIMLLAVICALNYEIFIFPNRFAPAGLNGICTMIQYLFGISIGYLSLIINIPLALLVYFKVSKSLAIRSMVTEVDPKLTVLALLPIPVAVFIILKLGSVVRRKFRGVQALFSELSGEVNETIMGVQVIKSFAKEEERQAEFSEISERMYKANVDLADTSSMIWPSISMVFGLCYTIGLIAGGKMVMDGALSLGSLVTFNGSLMLVQHPVMSLGRIINMLQRGLASFKRLSEILEQPGIPEKEMEDAKEPVGGDLEVKYTDERVLMTGGADTVYNGIVEV